MITSSERRHGRKNILYQMVNREYDHFMTQGEEFAEIQDVVDS